MSGVDEQGVVEQAAALRRLVARLDDTAAVLAGIRDTVAEAWDDAAGREWTARLDLVQRAADRLADESADEASGLERATDDGTACGMRLPGLTGVRGTGRRGIVAPQLPPMDR